MKESKLTKHPMLKMIQKYCISESYSKTEKWRLQFLIDILRWKMFRKKLHASASICNELKNEKEIVKKLKIVDC